MASLFSPYDFNPLDFDPFRKLLEAHVDFALLRTSAGPELLIAATDVATGLPRLFRRREMTRRVRAGLGLPADHPPRRDHRRPGLLGRRLLGQPRPGDAGAREPVSATRLIVKLNGIDKPGVPTTAREITARINQITFNQPMLRDIQVIETVRAHHRRWSGVGQCGATRGSPAIAST